MPAVLGCIPESRHAREAHAILDNPEELAVGEVLRFREAQIGRLRVKSVPDHRMAAPIIVVARRAVIREVQPRNAQVFLGSDHRVLGGSGV
jgi:hypothetical protein